ncbi:hypothetical protein [Azospirillum sp. TSO35-2]|uniref:hypothetical protein n=1 Tax=Azospirillum sp. TSO35-2 TaxID=716796 RepID=UPI000D62120C|nr:hypothetical protein [Azospirillum sp. TSO35-2]PWC31071.1 hypothetical protein TSO352_30000 [Azospirillum sp. TSO35-2]
MLVYGDLERCEDPRRRIALITDGLGGVDTAQQPLERHGALVTLFIAAAELAQGLADREFESSGEDDRTAVQDAAMAVVMTFARRVATSWASLASAGTAAIDPVEPVREALERLSALPLPATVRMRRAEGYAFYSLYPEAYLESARRLPSRIAERAVVIGLRSIGTGLAAMAAVALDAGPPVTLRPTGHPFRRELRVSPRLRAELLADRTAAYVIVDEGPGLSGSSFGAVADWLEAQGVPADRIAFLPGHGGDLGPQASERHRRRWAAARRPVVPFDALALGPDGPVPPLERWFEDRLGPPLTPLRDLSGGGWRAMRSDEPAAWPPTHPQQERRKFLLRTASGSWLLKFVGLGQAGTDALVRARALFEAGFTAEPMALRHGILAERWLEGARPLTETTTDAIDRLAGYLAFRARSFPAPPASGAGLSDLLAMARTNIAEALGEAATMPLERWTPERLDRLAAGVRRVVTDNRLHRWEWLRLPDGRLLKTDALDHAAAHDLIGCQDIAWDVAGAIVEWELSAQQAAALCEAVGRATPLDRRLVAFCLPCYLAFQIGYWSFAAAFDAGAAAWRDRCVARWRRWAAEAGDTPGPVID